MYTLPKIPHSKLLIISKAMKCYILHLQSEHMSIQIKKDASIITQFHKKSIQPKIESQLPSKTHKIKMVYHEAITLYEAFLTFEFYFENDLEHAIIDTLKNELHKQLI